MPSILVNCWKIIKKGKMIIMIIIIKWRKAVQIKLNNLKMRIKIKKAFRKLQRKINN